MIGIIIWGSKGREKKVSEGTFFCPGCKSNVAYEQRKASRWFTLYFIPVFPMETVGEWVRCRTCQGEFNMNILELSREEIEQALAPWTCGGCSNANPSSEAACLGCGVARQGA